MWAWGITPHAFLPWVIGWAPVLATLLLLWPLLGDLAFRGCRRIARGQVVRGPEWIVACLVGSAVWLLSDRLWFVGDFVMRQGSPGSDVIAAGSFFQSMPLDTLLHRTFPEWLGLGSPERSGLYLRALGGFEAACLGWTVARLARLLEFRGAAWWCFVICTISGGYLTILAGLGKASGEMCVLTMLIACFAMRIVRSGTGHHYLGLAQATALFDHRSAVVFLPVCIVTWWRWNRAQQVTDSRTRTAWLVGPALVVVGLALTAGRIADLIVRFDLPHHIRPALSGPPTSRDTLFQAALRGADIMNILAALVPLFLVGAVLSYRFDSERKRSGAVWILGALAVSCFPIFALVLPQQGIFRDWDVFSFSGVALSLWCACVVAERVSARSIPRWLVPAILAAAVVPSLQWLAINHDPAAGLARIRRFVEQTPRRPAATREMTWDFLANHSFRVGKWEDAAVAARNAVALAPHPRLLILWGLSDIQVGNFPEAYTAFRELTERAPGNPIGWLGLAGQAARLDRREDYLRAVAVLSSYPPNSTSRRVMQGFMRRFPMILPASMTDPQPRPRP